MTQSHAEEFDEDVAAREESLRDPMRTGDPAWKAPDVVDRVLCRGRCSSLVDWTAVADQAFRTWNAELVKRGEEPLERNRILFCDGCRTKGKAFALERNDKAREIMARLIRELKANTNAEQELALIHRIEALGHPDVQGLVDAVRAQRAANPRKRTSTAEVMR